jgi:DNA-binding beta-propeller fold protein YncE
MLIDEPSHSVGGRMGWSGQFLTIITAVAWIAMRGGAEVPHTFESIITGIDDPAGVAWIDDTNVVICDRSGDRMVIAHRSGSIVREFGHHGSAPGELIHPTDVVVLECGKIAVCDSGNDRIQLFWPDGTFIDIIALDWMLDPIGLGTDGTHLIVTDQALDRIAVLTQDGDVIRTIGRRGGDLMTFRGPRDADLDDQGRLIVADTDNHRLQILTAGGYILPAIGERGGPPGFFQSPSSVEAAGGRIYIADRFNHRVQVLDEKGEVIGEIGTHAVAPREAGGAVHYPVAIAISPSGEAIAISEPFERRVQIVDLAVETTPDRAVGRRSVQAHFSTTMTVVDDMLVIPEADSGAMAIFSLENEVPINISSIGDIGNGYGQFQRLDDVAAIPGTNRFVTVDGATDQLAQFKLSLPEGPPTYDPFIGSLVTIADPHVANARDDPFPPGTSIDVDNQGVVWMVDRRTATFMRSSTRGVTEIIPTSVELIDPRSIAVTDAGVAISDAGRRSVLLLANDGGLIKEISGIFEQPLGICILPNGGFAIADSGADQVVILNQECEVQRRIGTTGTGMGELWSPTDVAIDHKGRLIVLDHGNHRAQIFDLDGTWLVTFGKGRSYTPDRPQPPSRPVTTGETR